MFPPGHTLNRILSESRAYLLSHLTSKIRKITTVAFPRPDSKSGYQHIRQKSTHIFVIFSKNYLRLFTELIKCVMIILQGSSLCKTAQYLAAITGFYLDGGFLSPIMKRRFSKMTLCRKSNNLDFRHIHIFNRRSPLLFLSLVI